MDFEGDAIFTSKFIGNMTMQFCMTSTPFVKAGEYILHTLIHAANRSLGEDDLGMKIGPKFFPVPLIEGFQPGTSDFQSRFGNVFLLHRNDFTWENILALTNTRATIVTFGFVIYR
jgi:hypothetical protein